MRFAPLLLVFALGAFAQPSVTPEVVEHSAAVPVTIDGLVAAGDADTQLIVWSQHDANGTRVRWKRAGGLELFTAPLADSLNSRAIAPTITRSGDMFFIAWIDTRAGFPAFNDIYFVRTDLHGWPLDRVVRFLGSAGSVAGGFQLSSRATADRFHVYHALYEWQVLRDGSVPVQARTILFHPAQNVASNGRTTVFVGSARVPSFNAIFLPVLYLQAQREGAVAPASEDMVFARSFATTSAMPVVATNGDEFFLAWIELSGVMSQTLGADGRVLSVPGTVAPGAFSVGLSAAWDGSQYIVAWDATQPADIFGGTVTDNVVTNRFNIANSADVERSPALVPLGDGQSMVFYVKAKADRAEIVSRIITTRGRARRVR